MEEQNTLGKGLGQLKEDMRKYLKVGWDISVCLFSVKSNSATPWPVAHQTPLPMEFSRQEHWSGLPFSYPGDLPNSGIEPKYPADSLLLSHLGSPGTDQEVS